MAFKKKDFVSREKRAYNDVQQITDCEDRMVLKPLPRLLAQVNLKGT